MFSSSLHADPCCMSFVLGSICHRVISNLNDVYKAMRENSDSGYVIFKFAFLQKHI